ncbi:response regulator [Aliiglaciecola sp. CAU 1673]|uniref:response regulator n=1 Tax=Aliiglaciecola sp. CAU 1673 TaxID=3032595 RepID=UPI0023DAE3A2|nr:response regulator [Aliiglaciecola sp. CAU 1673]MDF2176706.1 response regulator [Aliiglaciecola sp. CAU 1673]
MDKNHSSFTVLVVDDDADVRAFLRSTLRNLFQCNVIESHSPEQAVLLYEKQHIDLVFLDIQMPGMDGLTLLQELRALHKNIKIVMISAHGTADNVKKAVSEGAVGFIVKPFNMQRIKAVVEKFI